MVPRLRLRRGVSLIEALIATLIFVVGVAGMFMLWTYSMRVIVFSRDVKMGTQVARADLEKARARGFKNLPLGTLDANTVTFQGTTVRFATRTDAVQYFDINGALLASGADATLRYYSLVRTTLDYRVDPQTGSATAYALGGDSVRQIRTTVTKVSTTENLVTIGIYLVRGGIS